MDIFPAGSRPSRYAPANYFTGTVRQDPIIEPASPTGVRAVTVTFEPGARTNWHTHPLGQTLLITFGTGLVQTWGEPIRTVQAGDVIWFPAGEKHWHGATATNAMSHVAMQEAVDSSTAEWMEAVTDEQYSETG